MVALAALLAALVAEEDALDALEATSLEASLVCEQLTANVAAMARPAAAAVVRVNLLGIAGEYPRTRDRR